MSQTLTQKSILARLLAKENIEVVQGNYQTAFFDVENRVLGLPHFKDVSKDLYDLPPDELASIPTVCGSLREALNSLENDHEFLLQGDVFNVDQLEGYMDLKWEEVYAVEHTPHPVEYGLYYSL